MIKDHAVVEKVNEVFSLVLKVNQKTDYSISINFNGEVGFLDLTLTRDREDGVKENANSRHWLNQMGGLSEIMKTIEFLKFLLKFNQVNFNDLENKSEKIVTYTF